MQAFPDDLKLVPRHGPSFTRSNANLRRILLGESFDDVGSKILIVLSIRDMTLARDSFGT